MRKYSARFGGGNEETLLISTDKSKGASFLPYSIEGGQPMECHTVYLLHFSQRYQHAGHYLGSSHNLTK